MSKASTFSLFSKVHLALAAAVATCVSLYYAIGAYENSELHTVRAQLINEGQQLAAATELARADGLRTGLSFQVLQKQGYLERVPALWQADEAFVFAWREGLSAKLCDAVNVRAQLTGSRRIVLEVKDSATEQTAKFGCLPDKKIMFYRLAH